MMQLDAKWLYMHIVTEDNLSYFIFLSVEATVSLRRGFCDQWASRSSLSLLPCPSSLNFSISHCIVVPWLLLPHEKERSVLSVLLKVKALLGLHKVRCRRLWSAQPYLYGIPSTPPAYSSLRCPTARLLPPLIPGCFLASLGLPILPKF